MLYLPNKHSRKHSESWVMQWFWDATSFETGSCRRCVIFLPCYKVCWRISAGLKLVSQQLHYQILPQKPSEVLSHRPISECKSLHATTCTDSKATISGQNPHWHLRCLKPLKSSLTYMFFKATWWFRNLTEWTSSKIFQRISIWDGVTLVTSILPNGWRFWILQGRSLLPLHPLRIISKGGR